MNKSFYIKQAAYISVMLGMTACSLALEMVLLLKAYGKGTVLPVGYFIFYLGLKAFCASAALNCRVNAFYLSLINLKNNYNEQPVE